MGRLALPHKGRTVDHLLPPRETVEPLIERTSLHWYWLGDFFDDGLDRSAAFVWAPPDESRVKFMVPRLLWQYENSTETSRTLLENTCGLFTCINPSHWRKRDMRSQTPARIVLPEHVEASAVTSKYSQVTVHIQRTDGSFSICGRIAQAYGLAKSTPITCDECIESWLATNQPFTEVK